MGTSINFSLTSNLLAAEPPRKNHVFEYTHFSRFPLRRAFLSNQVYRGALMIAALNKQLDFLGVEKRRRELSAEGDPLEVLARVIPWESFRRGLNAALGRDKVKTGRPPMDVIKMLKLLVLQHLYNLSDFQASYQLRDRISWQRFVGIELGEEVPDEKTLWAFR